MALYRCYIPLATGGISLTGFMHCLSYLILCDFCEYIYIILYYIILYNMWTSLRCAAHIELIARMQKHKF